MENSRHCQASPTPAPAVAPTCAPCLSSASASARSDTTSPPAISAKHRDFSSVRVRDVLRSFYISGHVPSQSTAPAALSKPPTSWTHTQETMSDSPVDAKDPRPWLLFIARVYRSFASLMPITLAFAATGPSAASPQAASPVALGLADAAASATAAARARAEAARAAAPSLLPGSSAAAASATAADVADEDEDEDDDDDDDDSSSPATTASPTPSVPASAVTGSASSPSSVSTASAGAAASQALGAAEHAQRRAKHRQVDSARLSCIQRAFDVFIELDTDHDMTITVDDLTVGLQKFDPNFVVSRATVERIFRIADTTKSGRLHFAEFYAIYACLTLLRNRFGVSHDMFLTPLQVRSALLEAGLSPSDKQIDHMFRLMHKGGTRGSNGEIQGIDFPQVLKIYLRSPRSESELFLQSWYHAGRSDFLHHKQHLEASPIQDFVAGTAAGVALTIVGHPFDTVKVRLQTGTRYTSAAHCVLDTVRREGPFALFKGMGSPMATIPLINAIVFAAYGQGREFFQWYNTTHSDASPGDDLALWQIAAAGCYAGLLNSVIACPVELIKTRLQIQYGNTTSGRAFQGPIDCVKHIIKASGVKGLFRGMAATIYREIPGYAGQFYCYEWMKRRFMSWGNRVESELTVFELLFSGGTAGMAGWIASYPMDYIKSQIQAEPWNKTTIFKKNKYLLDGGFFSAVSQTVARRGWSELWRGFSVCMLRAWPANAAGFLAYESVLALMRDNGIGTGGAPSAVAAMTGTGAGQKSSPV